MRGTWRWFGLLWVASFALAPLHARDAARVLAEARNAVMGAPQGAKVTLSRKEGAWVVSTVTLFASPVTDAGLQRVAELRGLEELKSFGRSEITGVGRDALSKLSDLRRLAFPIYGDADGLGVLTKLVKLEDLKLHQGDSTGLDCLSKLKDMPNLRRLDVFGLRLDDASLARYIKPVATLETLRIGGSAQITDAGISQLGSLRRLRSLSFGGHIGDSGVAALGSLEHLEELECCYNPGQEKGDLSGLRSLTSLCLSVDKPLLPASVRLPADLRRLTVGYQTQPKLDLTTVPELESLTFGTPEGVKASDLKWLGALTGLKELTVDGGNEEAIAIAGLAGLRSLTMQWDCMRLFDEAGVRAISRLHNLETLDLGNGVGNDEGLRALRSLTALRRLKLVCSPKVTVEGLAIVTQSKNLESLCLDLSSCDASPVEGLANIRELRHLTKLEVRLNRKKGETSVDSLIPLLGELKQLEDLCIWGTLTDKGLGQLAALKALRRLNLNANRGYTDAGLAALMEKSPGLEEVKLSFRPATKEGAEPATKPTTKPQTPPAEAP